MFFKLATLFIIVPIVELTLLIKLGQVIDVLPTVAIIFATGFLGAFLTKHQGRAVLADIRETLDRGELPGTQLLDGMLILIAGIVLITPGLLTDVTGLLLLFPPVRRVVRNALTKRYRDRLQFGAVRMGPLGWGRPQGDIIDVTAESASPSDMRDITLH